MFPNQLFAPQLFSPHLFDRPTHNISLSDTLVFVETLNNSIQVFFTDTLTFTDSLTHSLAVSLTDSLVFSDSLSIDYKIYTAHLSNTLTFTENLTYSAETFLSDTLTFTDSLSVDYKIYTAHIVDTLVLTEAYVFIAPKPEVVSDHLVFRETLLQGSELHSGPYPADIFPNEIFGFQVFARTTFVTGENLYPVEFSDSLEFNENFVNLSPKYHTIPLSDTLHFSDNFATSIGTNHYHFYDKLRFREEVNVTFPPILYGPVSDILIFEELLTISGKYIKHLSDELLFADTDYKKNVEGIVIIVPTFIYVKVVKPSKLNSSNAINFDNAFYSTNATNISYYITGSAFR